MRPNARSAAKMFIEEYFPNGEVAFLAGSVVRGEETDNSDLDVVIIQSGLSEPFRQSYFAYDWPIEAFVYGFDSYSSFFLENADRARPSLPQMCAEGIILKDNGKASLIKNEALQLLKKGPAPWRPREIDAARYAITDLLEDLSGSSNETENIFIVSKLAFSLHEFVLRANNRWIGEGKWILRALRDYDESFAEQFAHIFDQYFSSREKNDVIQFAEEVMEPYGGRLFHGFSSGKLSRPS